MKMCFLMRSRRCGGARGEMGKVNVFEHICTFTAVTTIYLVNVHSVLHIVSLCIFANVSDSMSWTSDTTFLQVIVPPHIVIGRL